MWAKAKYFPIFFSRTKIESAAERVTTLKPIKPGGRLAKLE
jgi:hypothetical protein